MMKVNVKLVKTGLMLLWLVFGFVVSFSVYVEKAIQIFQKVLGL